MPRTELASSWGYLLGYRVGLWKNQSFPNRHKLLKRKRMGIEPTRPAELISPVLKTGTVTRPANASK